MKPRVLIFSLEYYPRVSGAEIAIRKITDRLPDYDYEMLTLNPGTEPEQEMVGSVLVHRIAATNNAWGKIISPWLGVWEIYKLERERPIALFWCVQATYTSGAAYIFNILRFWRPIPIILTLQEGEVEDKPKWGFVNISWRLALRATREVTAISNYLAKRAREYGYARDAHVIPNGVELEMFDIKVSKKERRDERAALGLSESDTVLITTGRLVKKNAVSDIIKALAYLPEEVKFVSVGSGPLLQELSELAHSYKVSARVVWVPNVPYADIPRKLAMSDIFIRPSLSEGLGISFLDALAAGLPVIATPVGGIPDFLKDGVTGISCEVGNPVSIAECVKRLMANEGLRKSISTSGRALVREKYQWDKIAIDMKSVMQSLL